MSVVKRLAKPWFIYLCFLTLGLGTLLPWNVFITAESYWQYKFRNTSIFDHPSLDHAVNTTQFDPMITPLQSLYTPLQAVLSQLPNFIFLMITAIIGHRINMRIRLVSTLSFMVILFTITTALVLVDTDHWQVGFFAVTMITIIFINMCGAIFQGSLFGLAGMFPSQYMTAVVTGQALGGVFASAARIVSLMVGASDTYSAFIYFAMSVGVMLVTMCSLLYLLASPQYKESMRAHATEEEVEPLSGTNLLKNSRDVLSQIWQLGLTVVIVFGVTLSVFPALCVQIESVHTGTQWAELYYQPVMTFLLFNVGDLLGRQVGGIVQWPRQGSSLLLPFAVSRIIFLPLIALCYRPSIDPMLPSLIASDIGYGVLMFLFSASNGYLGSLCMIYGPRSVSDRKDAQAAGSVMGAMLGIGLVVGSASSFYVRKMF